jgi:hypothetical protein
MSAQVRDFPRSETGFVPKEVKPYGIDGDKNPLDSRIPFEALYQIVYGPAPRPRDLEWEYFLLECD